MVDNENKYISMNPLLEFLILCTILSAIFLIVYVPIERLTKNKPWYSRGIGLLIVACFLYIFSEHIGWRIECALTKPPIEPKCGFGTMVVSFVLAIFFAFIGSICFIKDGFVRYKK